MNLSPNSRVSGQPVTVSGEAVFVSGTVNIVSGAYVNVGSGIGVVAASGLFIVNDSGVRVVIQSGAPVSLQSGLPVNIGSGIGVIIQSGTYVNTGVGSSSISGQAVFISGTVAILSGANVNIGSGIGVTIQSGIYVNTGSASSSISGQAVFVSGTVNLLSGAAVNIGSGIGVTIQSGINVNVGNISGQNVIISGQPISISGNAVFVSGTVALLSGGYVNVGNISGQNVIMSGQPVGISGQAVFISGTVNILSGAYVNIGSGVGVYFDHNTISGTFIINDSGVRVVIQSGAQVSIQSGTYVSVGNISGQNVIISGQPVSISGQAVFVSGTVSVLNMSISGNSVILGSGIGFQMSGANVIASVTVGSGLGVTVATSGQGFPAIGGQYRPVNVNPTSGQISILSVDNNGALVVTPSNNDTTTVSSGLFVSLASSQVISVLASPPQAGISVWSGQVVIVSGQGIFIATSGQGFPVVGGQYRPVGINSNSGQSVSLAVDQYGELYTTPSNVNSTTVTSGVQTFVSTSGQGYPAIGGQYRPIQPTLASGAISMVSVDNAGNLVVDIAGFTTGASGLRVNIGSGIGVTVDDATMSGLYVMMSGQGVLVTLLSGYIGLVSGAMVLVSGNTAQMGSGQSLYVQMSGVVTQMSGQVVIAQPMGINAFNTGKIAVGTSGAAFPSVACAQVDLTMATSNVLWLGGGSAANANSGVGFMWSTTGVDGRQTITFNITNLNLIYGKAQVTSSVIYYAAT